jgi:hypothetical protein
VSTPLSESALLERGSFPDIGSLRVTRDRTVSLVIENYFISSAAEQQFNQCLCGSDGGELF